MTENENYKIMWKVLKYVIGFMKDERSKIMNNIEEIEKTFLEGENDAKKNTLD